MADTETEMERYLKDMMEQRDDREALLDRFVDAFGGSSVCGEHSNNNCPWHIALEWANVLVWMKDDLLGALEAIEARINGEWDHPALVAFGELSTNTDNDVLRFARAAIARARTKWWRLTRSAVP